MLNDFVDLKISTSNVKPLLLFYGTGYPGADDCRFAASCEKAERGATGKRSRTLVPWRTFP